MKLFNAVLGCLLSVYWIYEFANFLSGKTLEPFTICVALFITAVTFIKYAVEDVKKCL